MGRRLSRVSLLAAAVQGAHLVLDYEHDASCLDSVEKTGMAAGDAFFLGMTPGSGLDLSVVGLGTSHAWAGAGVIARVHFARISDGGGVTLRSAALRDPWNRPLPVFFRQARRARGCTTP